ncbi:hypothetical protein [Actinomadura miaoliensis]|uniref:Uncharacterized protein n=1 Tax=Actinomadura miaoliensis TaxID=430685 RepID=A0ABP7V526_9ACTN
MAHIDGKPIVAVTLHLATCMDPESVRLGVLESCRDIEKLIVDSSAHATTPDDLRTRAAAALRDWHARHWVVCEHAQIIDYGGAAGAVLDVVRAELDKAREQAKNTQAALDLANVMRRNAVETIQSLAESWTRRGHGALAGELLTAFEMDEDGGEATQ